MSSQTSIANKKPKLLEQVKLVLRRERYSKKTEEAYTKWIKEFVNYNDRRHPKDLTKKNVEDFLTSLALERKVSASTQNQAVHSISGFRLYLHVPRLKVFLFISMVHLNLFAHYCMVPD